jgi:hypothetical protein
MITNRAIITARRGGAAARARISAPTGAFVLPVVTPYEWQVFCEHLSSAARHRGRVRVRIGAVHCEVRLGNVDRRRRCASCDGPLSTMAFRMTYRELCVHCARRRLTKDIAGVADTTTE